AIAARTTTVPVTIPLVIAGGIEDREVLLNRTGCLLRLRPGDRLVARNALLLVHIGFDQACIDRKCFTANQPSCDARSHYALKDPAQCIALAEALVPRTAKHRMIGDLVLDAEPTKPAIGEIYLHLRAELPLRADCKHVTDDQHPHHQHRIDRRPTRVGVVGCEVLVYPTQIEHGVDLSDQMIGWHHLVEIKRIEELALSVLSPPHHAPLPPMLVSIDRITARESSQ